MSFTNRKRYWFFKRVILTRLLVSLYAFLLKKKKEKKHIFPSFGFKGSCKHEMAMPWSKTLPA